MRCHCPLLGTMLYYTYNVAIHFRQSRFIKNKVVLIVLFTAFRDFYKSQSNRLYSVTSKSTFSLLQSTANLCWNLSLWLLICLSQKKTPLWELIVLLLKILCCLSQHIGLHVLEQEAFPYSQAYSFILAPDTVWTSIEFCFVLFFHSRIQIEFSLNKYISHSYCRCMWEMLSLFK